MDVYWSHPNSSHSFLHIQRLIYFFYLESNPQKSVCSCLFHSCMKKINNSTYKNLCIFELFLSKILFSIIFWIEYQRPFFSLNSVTATFFLLCHWSSFWYSWELLISTVVPWFWINFESGWPQYDLYQARACCKLMQCTIERWGTVDFLWNAKWVNCFHKPPISLLNILLYMSSVYSPIFLLFQIWINLNCSSIKSL